MDKRVDRSAYEEELENREPVHVTEAELFSETLDFGNEIAMQAQKVLGSNLRAAIKRGGLKEAVDYCNVNAYPLMDSVQKSYQATIRRVSLKVRNEDDKPDSVERQLLEAYQYSMENNVTPEPNVQKVNNGKELLFTKPIVINSTMCLQCHGKPGTTLDEEFYGHIKKLYPEDQAIGYEQNDLRGMWSIRFPVSEIVKQRFKK